MKQFAFRLQKLLDWRRQRKEAQSIVVAHALADLQEEEVQLHALVGQHKVTQDGLRRHRAGLLNLQQVIHTETYHNWLRDRVERQKKSVAAATKVLGNERDALATLARDEDVLNRLRERVKEQYKKDTFRSEVRELDDIAGVQRSPDGPDTPTQPSEPTPNGSREEEVIHG